jgi:hypothetical protein
MQRSDYTQQVQSTCRPSKTVLFQCTPPINYNKPPDTDHEVEFVDISADHGLALVSSSGPEFIWEEWQYVSLIIALSGIHDLVLSYSDGVNVSVLDFWFHCAHDAGVLRYHLEESS